METLNEKQQLVIEIALNKENLFISGAAGTGKSYVLRVLKEKLRSIYNDDQIAVTALTGIAASTIDGTTLHSFAGFGYDLSKPIRVDAIKRWSRTKVLIVDEVSMMSVDLIEKLYIYVRKHKIQVLFFGDFYQLPPINGFPCFLSETWNKLGLKNGTIILDKIVRQDNEEFITVLNEIRTGNISEKSSKYLEQFDLKKRSVMSKSTTKLFAVNKRVDSENSSKLNKIDSDLKILKSNDFLVNGSKKLVKIENIIVSKTLKTFMDKIEKDIPSSLELKIGSEVILTKNKFEYGLVNGSRGKIISFDKNRPVVKFHGKKFSYNIIVDKVEHILNDSEYGIEFVRKQVPLKLAWGLTIHRSQGLTLDKVFASVSKTFEDGQIYTALSRVRKPENLIIDDVKNLLKANKVSKFASEYYSSLS